MSTDAPAPVGDAEVPRTRAGGFADSSRSSRAALRSLAPADDRAPPPVPAHLPPPLVPALHAVSLTVSEGRCTASVEVRRGGERAVAIAEGAAAGGGTDRLVAEATLRAIASFDPGSSRV